MDMYCSMGVSGVPPPGVPKTEGDADGPGDAPGKGELGTAVKGTGAGEAGGNGVEADGGAERDCIAVWASKTAL